MSPWRKGTRRRERRATSPESARARARAAAASAQPAQSEARAKSPQGQPRRRVAPSTRRALYETTSVTEAFCSRSAPIKRASAFCCILPLGVSRVACCRERQPALFFFGCRSARIVAWPERPLPALSVVELDKHKTPQDLPKPDTRLRRRHALAYHVEVCARCESCNDAWGAWIARALVAVVGNPLCSPAQPASPPDQVKENEWRRPRAATLAATKTPMCSIAQA